MARRVRGGPDIDPGFNGFRGFGGYVLDRNAAQRRRPMRRSGAGRRPPRPKTRSSNSARWSVSPARPQRHAHGWLLSSAAGEVRVSDHGGHHWSFSRADTLACGPFSVDIDNADDATSGVGCAVAVSVPRAQRAPAPATGDRRLRPPGPDDAHARAAAAALLSGLNISGSEQVDVGAPTSTVTMTQSVGGLVTQGLETSVTVDATGIEAATGRLEQPTKGDDYPLRTAKDAFADLNNRPRMMMMPYCGPLPERTGAGWTCAVGAPPGRQAGLAGSSRCPGVRPPQVLRPRRLWRPLRVSRPGASTRPRPNRPRSTHRLYEFGATAHANRAGADSAVPLAQTDAGDRCVPRVAVDLRRFGRRRGSPGAVVALHHRRRLDHPHRGDRNRPGLPRRAGRFARSRGRQPSNRTQPRQSAPLPDRLLLPPAGKDAPSDLASPTK